MYNGQKLVRTGWILALAALAGFLLWRIIVPSGQVSYSTDFSSPTFRFEPLLPAERVRDGREIIDEPVYLTVYTPRTFNTAEVVLKFREPVPAFSFGLARDKAKWVYDFKKIAEGSTEARLEFDLAGADRRKHRYSFMISAPGISEAEKKIILDSATIYFKDKGI